MDAAWHGRLAGQQMYRSAPTFEDVVKPDEYVAGRGRGATGFVTSAQVSLDAGTRFGQPPPGYIAGRGRGLGDTRRETLEAQVRARQQANARRFETRADDDPDDEGGDGDVVGNGRGLEEEEGGLFADAVYEEDDREADEIYNEVDEKMEARGKKYRNVKIQEAIEQYRKEHPTLKQRFVDLKRELADVTEDDWATIPDIGDYRVKRHKVDRLTPAPDSILISAKKDMSTVASVKPGATTDLSSIGEGRSSVLGLKLDRAGDSVSGQTNVDPKGYLTELSSLRVTSASDIGDIKKARLLLKSVTSTNPKHAPGWIAASRLEELDGHLESARLLILEGCRLCPQNEDVWIEAARLYPGPQAKGVLAQAVKHVPKSIKVWLQAAALEDETTNKRTVLRKALKKVPNSSRLWRAAVDLEGPEDAKILLSHAVDCAPQAVDLWLGYARLETYEKAKEILNRAREANPAEISIWLTAAKLEEAHGEKDGLGVATIVERAIRVLSVAQEVVTRDQWMSEAKISEVDGYPRTCVALVNGALGLGVEDVDRKILWTEDARSAEREGRIETARAIHQKMVATFPGEKTVWHQAALFEKRHGTGTAVRELLQRAVKYCPRAEDIWLMAAKESWSSNDVDGCRNILMEAFVANPNSEPIWIEAARVESETKEWDRARILMQRAREQVQTARVYMKSALVERSAGDANREEAMLREGLEKYPNFEKLWLMLAQLRLRLGDVSGARAAYLDGIVRCPNSVAVALGLSELEAKQGRPATARATLEQAIKRIPGSDELWLAAVRLEKKEDGAASRKLARALQHHPKSGLLWAEAIELEARPKQKAKSILALKNCEEDVYVLVGVARMFWRDGKIDKARSWFEKAVAIGRNVGDAWANFYAFELEHGNNDSRVSMRDRCEAAKPTIGLLWSPIRKAPENSAMSTPQLLCIAAAQVASVE
uniref:PRP1 splicing factor N-terminal domain-containing protein n=1 Tax=Compsopogon caeruleus TaxID=31354 RepID=A0A6T6AVG1_9RHOD|mmetsp:Transcript_12649/g.25647  ORF Transcript_12649/g.25647 Transcript_12649/m.25647 type:complete len:943 (+) Transcript_12649:49-2877(+)